MSEINSALESIGWTRYHYYCFIVCGCSWAGDMLWSMNVSITVDRVSDEFGLNSLETGVLLSTFMMGMLIGSYICGYLADTVSRMFVFKKLCLVITAGALLTGLFSSFWTIFFGLFLIGLGVGGEIAVSATVYSEICPSSKAWTLNLLGTTWCIGGMLGPGTAIILESLNVSNMWRVLVIAYGIVSVLFFLSRIPMLETPRFLLRKQKFQECNDVLKKISGRDFDIREKYKVEEKSPIWLLLKSEYKLLTFVYCVIFFGANFSSGGLFLFMPELIDESQGNISQTMTYSIMVIQQAAGIPGILLSSYLVDTWMGRKWNLIISFIMCGACTLLFLFAGNLAYLIVSSSVMFFFSFIGYSAMYLMVAETYPTVSRNTGIGVANSSNKLGGVVAPLIFGTLLNLPGGFYLVLLSAAFGYVLIGSLGILTKETRGVALDLEPETDESLKDVQSLIKTTSF